MYINQTAHNFDIIERGEIIKSFPIRPFETGECSTNCIKALNFVKDKLNLPYIDHTVYIKKSKK